MRTARLRAAFVAATAVWAALLVVAPFLASRAHASTMASAVIIGVYGIGSLVCHQLPERSYHLWTAQMPVCARCAGIYLGAAIAAVGARAAHAGGMRLTLATGRVRALIGVAVAPTLATLAYEWSTGDMPSHAIRAVAGLPIGLAVAWLVVGAADNQVD